MEKIKKKKSVIREWIEGIIVAFIIAMIIRTFIVQAFRIPTGSMHPTLKIGDRILVNKFIYGRRSFRKAGPERGDIIVFIYPENPKKDYIKRLIAFGGEKVLIKKGEIYVNGERLQTPATIAGRHYYSTGYFGTREAEVPEGSYFVLGDNSGNSKDSRYWGFVPQKNLIGKAFFIYWPLTRLGRPIY
jgi:signal peptidase I